MFVNPFSTDGVHRSDAINTDFDDYFEDQKEINGELIGKAIRFTGATDLDKSRSKSVEGSDRLISHIDDRHERGKSVPRNNSFTSLDHELKSSIQTKVDILPLTSLSDTLFTRCLLYTSRCV